MTPLQPIGQSPVTVRDSGVGVQAARVPGIAPAVGQVAPATGQTTAKPVPATQAKQATDKPQMERVIDDPIPMPRSLGDERERKPVPPLKSFAQIPTAMMAEINRLREEVAESRANTDQRRLDPTPMPAADSAIGPRAMGADPVKTDLKPGSAEPMPKGEPRAPEQGAEAKTETRPAAEARAAEAARSTPEAPKPPAPAAPLSLGPVTEPAAG